MRWWSAAFGWLLVHIDHVLESGLVQNAVVRRLLLLLFLVLLVL